MTKIQLNRFCLLLTAPFLGVCLYMLCVQISIKIEKYDLHIKDYGIETKLSNASDEIKQATVDVTGVRDMISSVYSTYDQSAKETNNMLWDAKQTVKKPEAIYDRRISAKLGSPLRTVETKNLNANLYRVNDSDYQGYALKVKLKSPKAMQMTLGKDKLGEAETTLNAAKRHNAVIATSFGGFADDKRTNKRYPLGTTMLKGSYVQGFFPSYRDLSFVGFDKDGKLIGGEFEKKEDLDALKPEFGASFVPVLVKNKQPQDIPAKWQTSPARAARMAIGKYKNDDLIILVTNATNEGGYSGATLKEIQDKFLYFGVIDAYNMDGGGSASLIFDGQIVNRPSDGQLRPLTTHLLFFK